MHKSITKLESIRQKLSISSHPPTLVISVFISFVISVFLSFVISVVISVAITTVLQRLLCTYSPGSLLQLVDLSTRTRPLSWDPRHILSCWESLFLLQTVSFQHSVVRYHGDVLFSKCPISPPWFSWRSRKYGDRDEEAGGWSAAGCGRLGTFGRWQCRCDESGGGASEEVGESERRSEGYHQSEVDPIWNCLVLQC